MQTTRTSVDRKTTVSISPTTLAEVWAFACQSGEFADLIGYWSDGANGRCGWGVLETMMDRMGLDDDDERTRIKLGLAELGNRAAGRLGYAMDGIQGANDAGVGLVAIGQAIQAEIDSALMKEYV